MMGPYQVGDPQVFERERVVLAHERQREVMMEVWSLALDFLVFLGD